jgi:hypothetical protein
VAQRAKSSLQLLRKSKPISGDNFLKTKEESTILHYRKQNDIILKGSVFPAYSPGIKVGLVRIM